MASFITFNPPIENTVGCIAIVDFVIGNSDSSIREGRGYPGHMRVHWLQRVRNAVVFMGNNVPEQQLDAAIRNRTTFTVIVDQDKRRVTMHGVTITSFSPRRPAPALGPPALSRYLHQHKKMMLRFQQMAIAER